MFGFSKCIGRNVMLFAVFKVYWTQCHVVCGFQSVLDAMSW